MEFDVVKSTKRNLIWSTILRLYRVLAPMFIRRVFIYRLGIEYSGLNGLFTSVLSFLNLAEMGTETAVVFFMYKPVQDGDVETVRRLLGMVRKYYKYIGLFVLAAGLAVTPFINLLIEGDVPSDINIYIIFLMNLASTVIPYWLFAYRNTILYVHMRNDLISRTMIGGETLRYAGQLLVLFSFANYYLYLLVDIVTKIIERLISVFIADKKYPMYKIALKPTADMKSAFAKKIKALIFHKIGGVIVNSADPIIISAFLGLAILGKYGNYQAIMTAVLGFVLLINTASQAGIGHLVAVNTPEENAKLFRHYSFLIFAMSSVCCCCFLNLYQPVITLWINSSMLLGEDIVVLLCVYFYVFMVMVPGNIFENASGLWHRDKYRPLLEGVLNLAMNLVLVRFIGLQGVLLSTILSMAFFSIPWLYHTVANGLLGGGFGSYIQTVLKYTGICAAMCLITYLLCRLVPEGTPLIVKTVISGSISFLLPVAILYLLYRKSENWKWMRGIARSMFKRAQKERSINAENRLL